MNLYLLPVRLSYMLYYICLQYISVVHKRRSFGFYTQCSACLQGLKLREPPFFVLVWEHSRIKRELTHTAVRFHEVLTRDEKKNSSPFKWSMCFYVLPFLKQCPFPLCVGEMTKKDNIVNSRCTCKTHSQCVCLFVCLFVCLIFIPACLCV